MSGSRDIGHIGCDSPMFEPHHAPSNSCMWMGVVKKVWRGLRIFPHGLVYEAEWGISCRVYEQDRKFSSIQRQDREQDEADNEADQGCSVTRPKDEEPIPSTHYNTRKLSVEHLHPRQVHRAHDNETEVHDRVSM